MFFNFPTGHSHTLLYTHIICLHSYEMNVECNIFKFSAVLVPVVAAESSTAAIVVLHALVVSVVVD